MLTLYPFNLFFKLALYLNQPFPLFLNTCFLDVILQFFFLLGFTIIRDIKLLIIINSGPVQSSHCSEQSCPPPPSWVGKSPPELSAHPSGLCPTWTLSCRGGQLVTTSLAPEPPFRDPMRSFLRRSLRHCPVRIKLIDVFSALHWSFWSLMVRLTDHVALLSFLQGEVASCSHMHAPCAPLSGLRTDTSQIFLDPGYPCTCESRLLFVTLCFTFPVGLPWNPNAVSIIKHVHHFDILL